MRRNFVVVTFGTLMTLMFGASVCWIKVCARYSAHFLRIHLNTHCQWRQTTGTRPTQQGQGNNLRKPSELGWLCRTKATCLKTGNSAGGFQY